LEQIVLLLEEKLEQIDDLLVIFILLDVEGLGVFCKNRVGTRIGMKNMSD